MSAITACLAENGPSAVFSFQAIEAMDHPPNATAQPDERMAEVQRRERALECPDVGQSARWNSALQNSFNLTHGTSEKVMEKCG